MLSLQRKDRHGMKMVMNQPPLSLCNDFVFKTVFVRHSDILADFLGAVFVRSVPEKDLICVNPEFPAFKAGDKLPVLDVKVTSKTLGVVDLEAQTTVHKQLWKRFLYYNCRMTTEQLNSGEHYTRLIRARSIVIFKENLIADTYCHHRYLYYDAEHGSEYHSSSEIHFFELNKRSQLDQEPNATPHLRAWLQFFAATTEEEFMSLAQTSPVFEKTWHVIQDLSNDVAAREMAEGYEKARREEMAFYDDGLEDGRAEGRAEGTLQNLRRNVRAMLSKGLEIEEISNLLDVPLPEIQEALAVHE